MSIKEWVQETFTGYHDNMWWDAFYDMSKKILPIMKQFQKADRLGLNPPSIKQEFPELPELDEHYNYKSEGDSKLYHDKYQWVLDEIVFALESCVEPMIIHNLSQELNPDYNPDQTEGLSFLPMDEEGHCYVNINEDYGKTRTNQKVKTELDNRVQAGLKYMGIFWQTFWD